MKSVWQSSVTMPEFPFLQKDCKTSVLIIGGGLAGILTAKCLHEKGIDYTLVEKDKICNGVTANTTAKITFQHGLIYDKLLKSKGFEKTQGYLRGNISAFEALCNLCNNIDCDFEIKDNFVYSIDDEQKLENEMSALEKIGYSPRFFKEIPLPINTVGAVCFPRQAQFNPLKLVAEISKGLNIYEHTFVRELDKNTAITDKGEISADKIIVATHFPFIDRHGSYFMKLYQSRSYVIALENAQDVRGMYLDENDKGLSFRNYKDLLFVGGGDHRTGKKGGNWAELRSFADTYYPQAQEKYYWATQDCMSLDSIPYIGKYSKRTSDLYVASGFNKWGMTGAMLSAMILTDMISDKASDYAEVFSPSRNMIKPQLLINGFETATNLLTFSKKRCTHLGCALKWNAAEHTWDCPCHGSRFDEKGGVIDNPANHELNNS